MPFSKEFEQQFESRNHLEAPVGIVEVVDIMPPNPKSQIPVLFAPGWRETPELQKGCLWEVYKSRRRVITVIHPTVTMKLEQKSGDLPEIEVQKARTLLSVLELKGIQATNIITHSEGAINSAIAALLEPKKFRNMVLVTPAGLTGKDSLVRVSIGFARHLARTSSMSILRAGIQKRAKRESAPFLQNIKLAMDEGRAITNYDLYPLFVELMNTEIGVAVLLGEKDTVFPYPRVLAHLSKYASAPNYGFYILATKKGGHELYSKPGEIMPQVEELLVQLEEKN